MASTYSAAVLLSTERIQRSISGRSEAGISGSACLKPSILAYKAKNAYVLSSVPKNFLWTSAIESISNSLGFQGGLDDIKNHRTVSAPYWPITWNGSTVLPRVFD